MSTFKSDLPLFVYGALKPGEISWPLISGLVGEYFISNLNDHELVMVGGIPMSRFKVGKKVQGCTVNISNLDEALRVIEALEGVGRVYKWAQGESSEGKVNFLTSIEDPSKASQLESWSTADDPYFGMAIPHVHGILMRLIEDEDLLLLSADSYKKYLDLQAAYSVLWTLFERTLLFTREGFMTSKQKTKDEAWKTNTRPEWKKALELTKTDVKMTVAPADDPYRKAVRFTDNEFLFFYQMRNNIVHRGKAAGADYKQLLMTAVLFLNIQSAFLQMNYPSVNEFWGNLVSDHESTNLKYQIDHKKVK